MQDDKGFWYNFSGHNALQKPKGKYKGESDRSNVPAYTKR